MAFTYCRTLGRVRLRRVHRRLARPEDRHCATSKDVELVMTPVRVATWQRQREGRPVGRAADRAPGRRVGVHLDPVHRAPTLGGSGRSRIVGDAYGIAAGGEPGRFEQQTRTRASIDASSATLP
jgi:hypothetical protein